MLDADLDILLYAIRVLFLLLGPLTLALVLAGMLGAAFQTVTGITEPAIGYASRLLALLTLLYFMSPMVIELLVSLVQMVYER